MDFSIGTCLFEGVPLEQRHLALLPEYGFKYVEIDGTPERFDWRDPKRVAQLARWLEEFGLKPRSLHLPFHIDTDKSSFHYLSLSEPYEPWLRQAFEVKAQMARVAADLGCELLVEHGQGDEEVEVNGDGSIAPAKIYRAWTTEQGYDTYLREFEKLWKVIEPLGLYVAVENVMSPGTTAAMLGRFCDAVGHERVGLCIDVAHSHVPGDAVQDLHDVGERLIAAHLSDNHGQDDEHLVPFEGTIDWPTVMPLLARAPRLRSITLEMIVPKHQAGEAAYRAKLEGTAAAVERLRTLID
ncbi:MAG: sugar phosphate isomerase/epimerase family protein [Candidatus Alcyoniella australis]|nr:sugar phosphate isomerase/epimerase family protein [Candidatus Alcyoniella australis]